MLSVILTILKIIGIILLVILGLLLTIVLVVLFVPVRYRSEGSFAKTEEGFKDEVFVRVTWLLHIVSITFKLKDKDADFNIRIFGRQLSFGKKQKTKDNAAIHDNKKENKTDIFEEAFDKKDFNSDVKTEKAEKTESKNIRADRESKKEKQTESQIKEAPIKETRIKETPIKETQIKEAQIKEAQNQGAKKVEHKEKKLQDSEIKSTSDKISDDISDTEKKKSIKEKLSDIWNKINDICIKIKNVKAVKDSFVEYLKREESKEAIKEIKHILFKTLRHILPRKLKAKLRFGFEDPATTGNVLGAASALYAIYGDKLELEPDFENVVLEGEYKLKGRIRVFTILIAAIKLYFNKWIKKFIAFSKKAVKNI